MNVSPWLTATISIAVLTWSIGEITAHPGHSSRSAATETTSPAQGDLSTPLEEQGRFVAAVGGQVLLRWTDDSLVRWQLSQPSVADRQWVAQQTSMIRRMNAAEASADQQSEFTNGITMPTLPLVIAQLDSPTGREAADKRPEIARAFEAFVATKAIKTRWDQRHFYVESNGIPAHPMMIGITAWQQQVPIPQPYIGDNAWQIPLQPVPAKNPRTAKGNFLRGAIAVAANGIPIFNPLNNRGDDAFLFGELDEFGGHCGRADDYHYHIAPVHLEKSIGKGLPIAYALDGYPIYGYAEPDGSPVKNLDAFNGHEDANGRYHYHATKTYPYINGGFHGEVTERDGQVDPQPRATGLRPALPPLRGAKITDFVETKPGSFKLTYEINGRKGSVSYSLTDNGSATFVFADTNGNSTTESYSPRQRGPGGNERPPRPKGETPAGKKGGGNPKKAQESPARSDVPAVGNRPSGNAAPTEKDRPTLVVTSVGIDAQGKLSVEYTCDGASVSPPVAWKNAPPGTKSFAISLWHTAPDQEKSYWIVYNIPADVTSMPKNSKKIGTTGVNDKRRAEYDPMCSKGPGVKMYHLTVFALSAELQLPAAQANRAGLLAAIKGLVLAEGTLDFQYERKQ